jgi:predicted RNA binding protein YcfA (HicA-like mRNA interferase family)
MGMVPIIKAARLVPILVRIGFRIIRQKGSHITFEHLFDKTWHVTVPMHSKDLRKSTLLLILKQARLSLIEFVRLLKK